MPSHEDVAPAAERPPGPPRSVLLVVGSPTRRRVLRAAVEADGDLRVVGEAGNGRDAVALVERLRPCVVLLDVELLALTGIEAIERIMAGCPTPILVCSGNPLGASTSMALEALAAGAVDVVTEPAPTVSELSPYADALRRRLRVAARIRVITHPRGRLRAGGPAEPVRTLITSKERRPLVAAAPAQSVPRRFSPDLPASPPRSVRLVAIGASTGGPAALATVLGGLPADLPRQCWWCSTWRRASSPGWPPGWTVWWRCRCWSGRAVVGWSPAR